MKRTIPLLGPAMGRVSAIGTPRARKGLVLVVVVGVLIAGLAMKSQIKSALRSGDTIRAEFSQNYGLEPGLSKVKVAGLQVGIVTGVEETESGTALVSMKVDDEALEALGSRPSARVAPLTLLGGQYSVELLRGGNGQYDRHTIPLAQTSTPVELDQLLAALPSDTREATQGLVAKTDRTFRDGTRRGLRAVVRKGPEILPPAGTFLKSLHGTRPGHDLSSIVTDLQSLAEVLDERGGQVDTILGDLHTTSGVLARHRGDLAAVVAAMPETLDATDRGVTRLRGTLERLDESTGKLRPTVAELGPLLDELEPTLRESRPVLADLPPILRDARAVVGQLVPTVDIAQDVLDDVRGPVIERVEGPILDKLGRTWHGAAGGPYANSGGGIDADNLFYEEIAYMIVNLDRSSMTQDPQGTLLNFQAGAGTSTVQPLALDEALAELIPQLRGDY